MPYAGSPPQDGNATRYARARDAKSDNVYYVKYGLNNFKGLA